MFITLALLSLRQGHYYEFEACLGYGVRSYLKGGKTFRQHNIEHNNHPVWVCVYVDC